MHDDVEAYVGDTPTDSVAHHNPQVKRTREHAALGQIKREYAPISQWYVELVAQYEAQQDPAARFVRVVDKIMVELIHFPNKATTLKQCYTYDDALSATEQTKQRLLDEYPEFAQVIEAKAELARYLANTYLSNQE